MASSETPATTAGDGSSAAGKPGKGAVELLTATQAREILERRIGRAIPRNTFYYWLRKGHILSFRLGGKILIPPNVMEEVIEHCLSGKKLPGCL